MSFSPSTMRNSARSGEVIPYLTAMRMQTAERVPRAADNETRIADMSRMTQVCLHIQNELIPWLRSIRPVRVDVFELDDYVETFNPPVDDQDRLPSASLARSRSSRSQCHFITWVPPVDVRQLIQWTQASDSLQFLFKKDLATCGSDHNLFSLLEDSAMLSVSKV
ncbi:uncharacterized protein CC84DRAFT_1168904 [Paraphaeosphaeria sporulosa]|uniref:Uncharacterized protein n=1 Tax=Paraphaeosphaeria sporulosa TaxID=1460663 RepID=A0A177BX59_9PLEO|nr:uncharacterized protein CC84DRAFT_1168904 [Paraphaeosphaeria sporulosa]OAG00003.1 hypothetical protein CC84DRAFT_1168904 [Paraphaeosphaeria sporulosa]